MNFTKKNHEHLSESKKSVSKNTIIKLILSALFVVLIGSKASAQGMPVYDNTNFISFVKSLLESGKQTSNLMKTVKFLKTQKENIDKVNDVIKQLQAVRELARNNQRLYDVVQDDLREILNSPFIKPNEVTRISDSFDAILQNSMAGMEYIDQILSNDNMKMTDAERAEVLKEKELESKEMVAEIEAKTRRYREIIQFREMQDKINNRETDY